MKTVSQRSTLGTVTKPDEPELQLSQPCGAGESGGKSGERKSECGGCTQDPSKVRSTDLSSIKLKSLSTVHPM